MAFPSRKKKKKRIRLCFNCCLAAKNAATVLVHCTDSCVDVPDTTARPRRALPAAAQVLDSQPTYSGDCFTREREGPFLHDPGRRSEVEKYPRERRIKWISPTRFLAEESITSWSTDVCTSRLSWLPGINPICLKGQVLQSFWNLIWQYVLGEKLSIYFI